MRPAFSAASRVLFSRTNARMATDGELQTLLTDAGLPTDRDAGLATDRDAGLATDRGLETGRRGLAAGTA